MPGHLPGDGAKGNSRTGVFAAPMAQFAIVQDLRTRKMAGMVCMPSVPAARAPWGHRTWRFPMLRRQGQCSLGDTVGLTDSARQNWDCWSEMQIWMWVQRNLGGSFIHRQSHWHHACGTHFSRRLHYHQQHAQSFRLSQVLYAIPALEMGCDLCLANQNTPSPQLVTGSGVGV